MKGTILIVEDDDKVAFLVKDTLEEDHYKVIRAGDGFEAKNHLARIIPDLILLDRKLPDTDGVDLCRDIKTGDKTKHIPVLFLTGKKEVTDKVVGLKMGADDYLTKPFHPMELLARVEAILRRTQDKEETSVFASGDLTVDLHKHEVYIGSTKIDLWPKEFSLLIAFMERKNHTLTREFLFEQVWGYDFVGTTRVVDVTVTRLRDKIGLHAGKIETVKGFGYQFVENDESEKSEG